MIFAQQTVQQITSSGFLPTRGSFMLDFLFLALFALVLLMGVSVWLVRSRRKYAWHKRIQIVLAVVLLVNFTSNRLALVVLSMVSLVGSGFIFWLARHVQRDVAVLMDLAELPTDSLGSDTLRLRDTVQR